MPMASRRVCLRPGCPEFSVHRGYCARHRQSEAQRGYGREHRIDRVVNRPGATCERCGCTANLQRDHRVPASLGGDESPSNKRWLCRCAEHRCHDTVGVRVDRQVRA